MSVYAFFRFIFLWHTENITIFVTSSLNFTILLTLWYLPSKEFGRFLPLVNGGRVLSKVKYNNLLIFGI